MIRIDKKACSICVLFGFLLKVRVKIEGDNEPQPTIPREEGQVPFVFVGTVESISNAKILLQYHLAHLKVSESFLTGFFPIRTQ